VSKYWHHYQNSLTGTTLGGNRAASHPGRDARQPSRSLLAEIRRSEWARPLKKAVEGLNHSQEFVKIERVFPVVREFFNRCYAENQF
jgi:hypothetical protein